jgi:hypothetical protein
MLKPAILYKDELLKKFAEFQYTERYFWYAGYGSCNELPIISSSDGKYQWAILDNKENLIGYFAYQIQTDTDTVLNFGLFSFETNIVVAKDVFDKMNELVKEHRRIEWRMVGDNPVQRNYDKFCKDNNGNIVHLHKVTKDTHNNWHDEYIYEIVKEN